MLTIPLSLQSDLTYPMLCGWGFPSWEQWHTYWCTRIYHSPAGVGCVILRIWEEDVRLLHHSTYTSTLLKVLKHFSLLLTNRHVVVRTDNITAAVHINCPLSIVAGNRQEPFAVVSRTPDLYTLVQMLWGTFRKTNVDLLQSKENVHCGSPWMHKTPSTGRGCLLSLGVAQSSSLSFSPSSHDIPFELMAQLSPKVLSIKTALPPSAKRMSNLCVLSISQSCLSIRELVSIATLQSKYSFTSEVLTSTFQSRSISPCLTGMSYKKHLTESASCRQADTAAVHHRGHSQGLALPKQRLPH